ncbi:MAG: tetratricopeptide repeat protein, partial [Pirellulaceae bacterium]
MPNRSGSCQNYPVSPNTPTAIDPLIDLGRTLHQQGDYVGAREAFEQVIQLVPDSAPLHCELARICQESQDHESALTYYRRALKWEPDLVPALQNLGFLLANQGEAEQAIEVYERALQVHPTPMTQLLAALVLPVIYESAAAVSWWRNRVVRQLAALTASGLRVETSHSQIPTNFYLAYQGWNDRDIADEL